MKVAGQSGRGKCMTLGDRCQVSSNSTLPPDIQIVTFTAFNCPYMCWPLTNTQLFWNSVQYFRAVSLLKCTNMLSSISEHNEQMV